jgi:macrolide-specific efflux system membrane fusion protein
MYASLLIAAALLLPGADGRAAIKGDAGSVTVSHCLVSLIDEAQVPSKEPGVLRELLVKEGDQVTKDQQLAQVDDRKEQHELEAAQYKWESAKQEATNDVNVRYAKAGADVYRQEVLQNYDANQKVAGTVSQTEVRRAELKHKEFILQAEASEFKMQQSAIDAKVREAESRIAAENIERRKIRSPLDGVVVERRRKAGEWVQPGDPVIHVMRLDRLRVEGFVPAADYSAAELDGRPVTITVVLAHGRREQFQGKVVFVNPEIDANGEFRVWAEVFNRQENEHWLLNKGMIAEMTIHLK